MTSLNSPPPQIPDYLRTLIDEIAVREGFTPGAYSVTPTSGSNHGDGFQGIVLAVAVSGARRRNDGTDEEADARLALICKMPPADGARREMFKSDIVFGRELHAYNTVLPLLERFQRERGVERGSADGFFQFPRCYGSLNDAATGNIVLVLEDLRAGGYQMWNRFETLDLQHASLALGELGKFHALSFVLRDQRPELLEQLKQLKSDTMLSMIDSEAARKFWVTNFSMAADTLDVAETDLKAKITRMASDFHGRLVRTLDAELAEPFGVLNHGDFWNNNMMYQYKDGRPTAQALCVIDWQLVQFCSPAVDIAYFLFSSTERELRRQHFWPLIRVYYDRLAATVRALGSDPERLFRYEDLRAQLQQFAEYGLVMAPMLVQVVTARPEELPDFDEVARNVQAAKGGEDVEQTTVEGFVRDDNPTYRQRMSDVIRDYFELGFGLQGIE